MVISHRFLMFFLCLPEGIISLTTIITIIIHYSPSINHYFRHDHPSSHRFSHETLVDHFLSSFTWNGDRFPRNFPPPVQWKNLRSGDPVGELEACCGEIRRLIEIWVDRWISAYFGYCVFSIFSFYWCNWQVSEVRPSKLRFLLYFRGLKAHLRRSKSTFWVENAGLLKYMLPLMTSEPPGHPRIIFILEKELHKLFTIYIVWSIIYGTCFLCFSIKLLFQNFCCHSSQPPRDPIHLAKVGEPTHLPGEVMAGLLE